MCTYERIAPGKLRSRSTEDGRGGRTRLCGGMVIITFMVTSVRGETNQNVWLSLTVEENTHVLFFMNAQRMIVFRGTRSEEPFSIRLRFGCAHPLLIAEYIAAWSHASLIITL